MVLRLAMCLVAIVLASPAAAKTLTAQFVRASSVALKNPHDIKLSPNGSRLFVSDVGKNRIAILDATTLDLVGSFGADHQSGTHDIDFDAAGHAYVADTHNNRVTIYEMLGNEAKLTGELKGGFRGPEGVLAHPNGRVYVAGAWSHNVVAFEDGKIVAELKGLASPHDLERAPDGNIWLSDAGNNRMVLLSLDLKVKRELKGPRFAFNGVRYQDILPDGTIITADKNNHRVLVIGPDDSVRLILGTGKPGKGPGQFKTPEGVEVRGDMVWLSDSGNDRIVVYRIKGL